MLFSRRVSLPGHGQWFNAEHRILAATAFGGHPYTSDRPSSRLPART